MRAPAPWRLTGRGLVVAVWLPARQVGPLAGLAGPGAVMWVDYAESGVGPYGELLVARQVRTADGRRPHVSQIVVDSVDSVENGRQNWEIPKTLATVSWSEDGTSASAEDEGGPLGRIVVRPWGPRLPVGLDWLPSRWRTLHQPRGELALRTTVRGSGGIRPCALTRFELPEARWPDLRGARVLGAVVVSDFELIFPAAVTA
jgi:hypothetical protein